MTGQNFSKQLIWFFLQSSHILRRPQNFAKFPPYFCLQYIQTKGRWRFRKILWPSQNVWTLLLFSFEFHFMSVWHSHTMYFSMNWSRHSYVHEYNKKNSEWIWLTYLNFNCSNSVTLPWNENLIFFMIFYDFTLSIGCQSGCEGSKRQHQNGKIT